ncbi:hypothetical protein ARAM_001053 [Aspergillus rambellii]|uniref:Uncharacterized protein n=1 Tax=Aspergillus rambellii TaxID=308745 RepID=A0A0F8XNZ5_9EURO|nr:hypothetical protein ARAM_001053 [Aspergillus rambellii]
MPSPESQKHKELRGALRALAKHFNSLETHQFDYSHLKTHKVDVLPMDLDNSKTRPKFFTPCAASLLMNPDYEYDRTRRTYCDFDLVSPIRRLPMDCARNMISYFSYYIFASDLQSNDYIHGKWSSISVDDTPFTGLFDHASPEYGTPTAAEYTDHSCTHMKAMIYNDLEGLNWHFLSLGERPGGGTGKYVGFLKGSFNMSFRFSFDDGQPGAGVELLDDKARAEMEPFYADQDGAAAGISGGVYRSFFVGDAVHLCLYTVVAYGWTLKAKL